MNQIPHKDTVEVTNRFKGLYLIDRVPEELWTEVCDTVQEAVIKTVPMEKKCKKSNWLSEEPSQIAMKRREAKGKGEKERYIHFAFLHFFFLGMILIPASCTMSQTSVHSSSGTLPIRFNPLNLFVTSTV